MSGVYETHSYVWCQPDYFVIVDSLEIGQGFIGVVNCINRFYRVPAGTAVLAVFPLDLHFLDVSAVGQQHLTQFYCGRSSINYTFKPVLNQFGNQTAVIYVSVRQQDIIHAARRNLKTLVVTLPYFFPALIHAAFDHNPRICGLQKKTGAGDNSGRPQKLQTH
ncbi:MAG: hypothetical protein BWY65_01188 [Firmicutes bacterium ADurb.Bin373]|nr:MAG: hypothetical protein BWY65_01188 [Firmicutes bacterium ADurb.Bin373]